MLPTILICIVLAAMFFFAIRRIAKKGPCGGSCDGCAMSCSQNNETTQQSQ